jgi:hypothetical protein
MRSRVALLTAVLAFAVGVTAIAVVAGSSGDDDLPLLAYGAAGTDQSAAAGESRSMATADMALYPYKTEYRMAPPLAKPAESAPAYRLNEATKADAQRLAAAFGLGDVAEQDQAWTAGNDAGHLQVDRRGNWWFGPDKGDTGVASSPATGSVTRSATAVAADDAAIGECAPCPPDAICTMECKPPTRPIEPVRPQGMPTPAEAESLARDIWDKAGIEVGKAKVDVQDGYSTFFVHFVPLVDGQQASGLEQSISIGPNKEIQYASGSVVRLDKLGDYPLVDTADAVDRLNNPPAYDTGGREPAPMPAEAREGSGTAVMVDPAPPSDSGSGSSGSSGSSGGSSEPGAPPTKEEVPVPAPMPMPPEPMPEPEPRIENLTGVRLGLQFNGEALLPVYIFTTESGGETWPVPAVPDKLLAKRAQ